MTPAIVWSLVALIQGVGDPIPVQMATGQNFPSYDACSDAGKSMVQDVIRDSIRQSRLFLSAWNPPRFTFDCVPFESIRR